MNQENQCCETPIADLLRRVPVTFHITISEPGPMGGYHYIPVGAHCHAAALEIDHLKQDLHGLQMTFDLQQNRMARATLHWRKATGHYGISPDLGRLLDWLLEERSKLRDEVALLKDDKQEILLMQAVSGERNSKPPREDRPS